MSIPSGDPFVVSIDVGSSSVRALLFDSGAHQMEGYGAQVPYRIRTTPDGGAEVDSGVHSAQADQQAFIRGGDGANDALGHAD